MEPSDFDRGYEQGYRAAMLTASLSSSSYDDEATKNRILETLSKGFHVIYKKMYPEQESA